MAKKLVWWSCCALPSAIQAATLIADRGTDASASPPAASLPAVSLMRREGPRAASANLVSEAAAVVSSSDSGEAATDALVSAVSVEKIKTKHLPVLLHHGGPAGRGGVVLLRSSSLQDPEADVTAAYTQPGPRGERGPRGSRGTQGAQGAAGPLGIAADAGTVDLQQLVGPKGAPGPPGCDGNKGAQGPTGAMGNRGVRGKQGVFTETQKREFDITIKQLAETLGNAKQLELFEQHILRKRLDSLRRHLAELHVHLEGNEGKVRQSGQELHIRIQGELARIEQEAQKTAAKIEQDRVTEEAILAQEAALRDQVLADTQEVQRKMT